MLYNFILSTFSFPGINLFKYITFRSCCSLFLSFFVCVFIAPHIINFLKKVQGNGQPIRECGPKTHFKKKGTPTMGGIIIIISSILSTLVCGDLFNQYVISTILVSIAFGAIGALDDWTKLKCDNSNGITAKQKFLLQVICAAVFSIYIESIRSPGTAGMLTFPFFKNFTLILGVFLPVFSTFVIVGSSNAVNLTDGLDGLAIVPTITCATCFGVFAYLIGNSIFSNYLNLMYIPSAGELCVVCSSLIGAGLGFLWFNAPPASIFMGDTGSLFLGALIGSVSVIVKQEFLLAICGGVFVIEAISVILQVFFFKKTGKRIFLMTPIHHHFEQKGWLETKVVIRFWIVSILLAILTLITLKVR